MNWLKIKPISFYKKQLYVIIGVNIFSLAVASGLLYSRFLHDYQDHLVSIMQSKLMLLSSTSSSALLFNDELAATITLDSLKSDSSVRFAQIYDSNRQLFAEYIRADQHVDMSIDTLPESPFIYQNNLYLCEPIELDQHIIGFILISSDNDSLQAQKTRYAYIVVFVFLFSLFLAYILNWRLQKRLTAPISELVKLMRFVAKKGLYHKRLVSGNNGELGDLFNGVNSMLDTIQTHEQQQKENNERLEGLVELRTKQLFNRANYDGLTQLPNRHLLTDRIDHGIRIASNENSQLALMFLDLNRFKVINDNLGHSMGDKLLEHVAKRLTQIVREADSVARWGGDEFVILLEHMYSREDVKTVAEQIVAELNAPVLVDGHQLHISASIGISVYPEDGIDPSILLKHADMSMYKAKELGLGQYCFFQQEMLEHSKKYLTLENDLRKAVEQKDLLLMYQPQISSINENIVGVEALIRWNNNGQVVNPSDFLAVAEEVGLMTPISIWVLQQACWQNKQWQLAGFTPIRIAVNISASSIMDPLLIEHITQALEQSGLEAKWLEIEITETNFISSTEYTTKVLRTLQNMGVHVSIDDFGTGYSCMSYLQELPINTLKIDGSFIQKLGMNKASNGIVQSIVTLGKSLNLQLVAECAETQEQVDALRNLECDVIQGYFYSRPLSAEDMYKYLLKSQRHGSQPAKLAVS